MARGLAAAICAALVLVPAATMAAPKVVATIVPIHSLVAGVMKGVAEPQLLIPVGASPHNYALKPSDARALQSADLIVWMGDRLETYLDKPLKSLAGSAKIVKIAALPGLTLHEVREGGAFETHGHDDDHGHAHAHNETDMHVWLDPDNARTIVARVANRLTELDPKNAAAYTANAKDMDEQIAALDRGIESRLSPVKDRPYIVFHDAYQYFERHYGTKIVGSITVSPDQALGAKRLAELRDRIRATSAVCVFREPQFPAPIVDTLVSGTGARIGTLDPEGADIAPGTGAYFVLMDRIADSLATCLKPGS